MISNKIGIEFLADGGEMGARIRDYDWSATSLGPSELWPQSLRTTLSILVYSRFPMYLFWGEEAIQFYNDAYRVSMPDQKHPMVLGKTPQECWPDRWSMLKPLIDQVMERGEVSWSEDQKFRDVRNGVEEDVYWTYSYSPVMDEYGKVAGVFVACTETTEKVKSLQRLSDSEEQLRFAIDSAELGTWDLDPSTGRFQCNNRLKEWFGLTLTEEVQLQTAIDVIAAYDRDRVATEITNAMRYESGGRYDIEYTIIHPRTHTERIVRAKGQARFNDSKLAVRFNGTLQDVTQVVKDRLSMEASEARLRILVEENAFATAVLEGPLMVVTLANEALLKLWGSDKSGLGKPLQAFTSLQPDQDFITQLESVYATGASYSCQDRVVYFIRQGQTQEVFLDYHLKALYDGQGEVEGILFTGADVTDKVLTQRRLVESEQQIRSLVEAAPFPIGVYIGKEMRIQFANKSIMDAWGKGYDVVGKLYADILPELNNQQIFEQLDQVFTTGKPFSKTNQRVDLYIDNQMRPFYFNYTFTPLFDNAGRVYGVMNTAADVTDLNLAKIKIEESEERFRTMVQRSPVAIGLTLGRDMIFENINAPMLEIIGVQEDVIGKRLVDVVPELQGQAVMDILYQVYDSREPFSGSEVPVVLNGDFTSENPELRYFNISYTPIFEYGEVAAILHVAVDVTVQVKAREKILAAEAEVRNTAERLEMAIEAGNFGSFESIFATGEIFCTPTCKRNVGLREDESLTYERLMSIILPEDLPEHHEAVQKAIQAKGSYNVEHRVRWPDGAIRWIRAAGKPVYNEQGEPLKMVGITVDITEQKIFAEELSKQVRDRTLELRRSNEDLLQFAHVTSHDLKEPVRKIKLFGKRLQDEHSAALPASGKLFLDKIQVATDRMLSMIEGVLTYSTINSTRAHTDTIDLNTVIGDIETDLEVMIQRQNAAIYKEDLPEFEGATILIYQLFYNIINNALKFLSKDRPGEIRITSQLIEDGKCAEITIADNGIGFEQEYSQKIFDTFTRLNSKDKFEGTGLGLALCKKIVDRHRGKISATSVKDKGSVFTIILPLKQVNSRI